MQYTYAEIYMEVGVRVIRTINVIINLHQHVHSTDINLEPISFILHLTQQDLFHLLCHVYQPITSASKIMNCTLINNAGLNSIRLWQNTKQNKSHHIVSSRLPPSTNVVPGDDYWLIECAIPIILTGKSFQTQSPNSYKTFLTPLTLK